MHHTGLVQIQCGDKLGELLLKLSAIPILDGKTVQAAWLELSQEPWSAVSDTK